MPHIHVTGTERRFNVVVAVEDRGEWRMFLPFPAHRVRRAAPVGTDRFVCLSEAGDVRLIDHRSGADVARATVRLRGGENILVVERSGIIVLYDAKPYFSSLDAPHSIHILRADDLATIATGDAIRLSTDRSTGRFVGREAEPAEAGELVGLRIRGRIVEDTAGRLGFVGEIGARHALFRIDGADLSVSVTPIPEGAMPWQWFSPSGGHALAPHIGRPFAADDLDGAGAGQEAFLAGYHGNKGTLELWATAPPRLVRLIGTGAGLPHDFVGDVVWEPDETGFWAKFVGNSRRIGFQRVGLDGSLSPAFGFDRFRDKSYPVTQDIADVADPAEVEVRVFADSSFIQRAWCTEPLPFRLIGEQEDGFRPDTAPYPPEAAVTRFLARSARPHVVIVRDFSAPAVADGLRQLAGDIGERLGDLCQDDVLELSFKVGRRTLTETRFFGRLAADHVDVAAELRQLLLAYLRAQPAVVEAKQLFRQLWGPEGQGALGPAMQALLRLDPAAHDVFRTYLALRDGEHETHSTDVIMKDYVAATGWRDRAMIGFGIYFALIRQRDGREALFGGLLDEYGLVEAAAAMIGADEFAALIVAEIDRFVVVPGLDRGDGTDLYRALQPSLETSDYGLAVLAALPSAGGPVLARREAEQGVNPDFLAAVAVRDEETPKAARPWWARLFGRRT